MTAKVIDYKLKRIERNIKNVHPDNPIIIQMNTMYRELLTLILKKQRQLLRDLKNVKKKINEAWSFLKL